MAFLKGLSEEKLFNRLNCIERTEGLNMRINIQKAVPGFLNIQIQKNVGSRTMRDMKRKGSFSLEPTLATLLVKKGYMSTKEEFFDALRRDEQDTLSPNPSNEDQAEENTNHMMNILLECICKQVASQPDFPGILGCQTPTSYLSVSIDGDDIYNSQRIPSEGEVAEEINITAMVRSQINGRDTGRAGRRGRNAVGPVRLPEWEKERAKERAKKRGQEPKPTAKQLALEEGC